MTKFARAFSVVAALAAALSVGAASSARAAAPSCLANVTVSDHGDDGGSRQLRSMLASVCTGGLVKVNPGTFVLQQGQLFLDRDVVIRGLGDDDNPTVIDGNGQSRVFLTFNAAYTLQNLTITGGNAGGSGFDGHGGGIAQTSPPPSRCRRCGSPTTVPRNSGVASRTSGSAARRRWR